MKKKICFVVAIPMTAQVFLRDHMLALSNDYDIYIMGTIDNEDSIKDLPVKGFFNVEIVRGISILKDCWAIYLAWKIFRNMKFDAVHSVTPKAGLVTALAGKLAGVKNRIHIFTGQVWATKTGFMRNVLKSIDKIIVHLDNYIIVDGKSQRSFLVREGVLTKGNSLVFCNGSIAGVNSDRFKPDAEAKKKGREEIGIKDGMLTYIFLGRLNHDKGIGELLEAYNKLAKSENDVFLLLVGPDEEDYIKKLSSFSYIKEGVNFHYYGQTREPEIVLNAGDVFVLPTYREGFGSSVLEAACIGIPCICSDAYGVLDAYEVGETGLQCHVGDSESLYRCMKRMYDDREMVKSMGEKSRIRALKDFNVKPISESWLSFYKRILE